MASGGCNDTSALILRNCVKVKVHYIAIFMVMLWVCVGGVSGRPYLTCRGYFEEMQQASGDL